MDVQNIRGATQDPLAATPFGQRVTLLDADLETVAFLLDNRQGPPRLLRLVPAPDGELERLYSEKRRRHRAMPVTHTEWRVRWLDLQAGCPDTPPPWTSVSRLWNYIGPGTGLDAWEVIAPPPPAAGESEWLNQDALPAPVEGPWTDIPDPDDILLGYQRNAAFTLSARFDYVADPVDPLALDSPALIRDWHYEIPGDPGAVRDCFEARYFQQRQVVRYESLPGYPRDEIVARSETLSLAALAPVLADADDGIPLDAQDSPFGPVYRIPAGSRVRITLRHHSPALTPYDDPAATNPAVPGDHLQPQRLDQAYLWRLPRRLDCALYPDVPPMPCRGSWPFPWRPMQVEANTNGAEGTERIRGRGESLAHENAPFARGVEGLKRSLGGLPSACLSRLVVGCGSVRSARLSRPACRLCL